MTDQQTLSTSAAMKLFDAYQVQPVVETTAPDGIEKNYELFATLADAQKEVDQFRTKGSVDGLESQAVLWSLYGLRDGIAEHLADRLSEAEAFALLFAISGISGTSGETHYPVPDLWAIVHTHRFGTDVRVAGAYKDPTETQVVRCFGIDFEPHLEETLEIFHVHKTAPLDWQEGDDRPFPDDELDEESGFSE